LFPENEATCKFEKPPLPFSCSPSFSKPHMPKPLPAARCQREYPAGTHGNKAGYRFGIELFENKTFSREHYIGRLSRLDSALPLTKTDRYNLYSALVNNLEWVYGTRADYSSKKPIWKHFYKTPATLYEVNEPHFSWR
jgi:hypothetical protein